MKKCMSELELEALLALEESRTAGTGGSPATTASAMLEQLLARAAETKPGLVSNYDIGFGFGDRDALIGSGPHQMWSHEVRPTRHPTISTTMESQSSICVESPNSFNKPMERENRAPGGGGSSGSDSDDDESLEMDASHQSGNPMDVKRMRRMVSNRDSARRSRKRKQAHLVDLESQVDTLRGENSSLFKQLTDANHTFSTACTDNRVLKSDVERLRLQVKMAEDMVARGALSCGLDRILQAQIGSPQIITTLENNSTNNHSANHMNNNHNHNNNFRGDENCYVGLSVAEQVHSIAGLDPPSIWEWDSNPSLISKQI